MKVQRVPALLRRAATGVLARLATLVGVITLDVLPGLVIGIVSMLLLVVYNASRPHLSVLGAVPGVARCVSATSGVTPTTMTIPDVLVLRLEAPLFYVNASLVRDRIKMLVGARRADHPER